ncbi:Pyridine nucleotide-disulphide oxidoreductase family protein [Brugia malayi]|uniref:Pyridine nucleotide-disulfide oxidoreductase domain-containing protein 1 n=5 Tax=Brugia TaxID=6278 RepID=A0A4E9F908_BRUMA|nr:Pyridine nucleotide-disulfide oxidoreductase family protein [Brugia malayi]VIO93306.1 Pyridine nucleotide-disulphide oxidoreductase family protein [Brugia malayi]
MASCSYVIVGGGVAAVSCVEELRAMDDKARIIVVSSSQLIKTVVNQQKIGQLTELFDIAEQQVTSVFAGLNVTFVKATVTHWDWKNKELLLDNDERITYDKLCIATGGRPKANFQHALSISIRDTETVDRLRTRIKDAKRVLVIGNGGIATEIVHELKNIEIIWAIRHSSISATFFDEGAAEFFKPMLVHGWRKEKSNNTVPKRYRFTVENEGESGVVGCALGPEWASTADISGALSDRQVHVIYEVELKGFVSQDTAHNVVVQKDGFNFSSGVWPLYVELTNGKIIGCDLMIEATGVQPNSDLWARDCHLLNLANDGGIIVNEHMLSSVQNVYACGDVCTASWPWAKHWMQMRLWTQARQMGAYCGRAMVLGDAISLDFCFEMFTHVTSFFGFKVIFLGRFNGEGVEKPFRILLRITKDTEYVKLIVANGRIQGAVLVGETDLEETIENLILNQIDISQVEEGLLDPDIEVADYFD